MKKNHGIPASLPKQQQQGDVLLDLVRLPDSAKQGTGRCILAYGEVTGHVHEVLGDGVTFYEDGDAMYIVLEQAATLVHEEHHAQTLAPTQPGYAWRRRIVREYDHFKEEAKRVLD